MILSGAGWAMAGDYELRISNFELRMKKTSSRILNSSFEIRNSQFLGGGRVRGFLDLFLARRRPIKRNDDEGLIVLGRAVARELADRPQQRLLDLLGRK